MSMSYEEMSYPLQVADVFIAEDRFGDARATEYELGALRQLYLEQGEDRDATLQAIERDGYPAPDEVTPEMVAVTGAAHACGVAINLARARGVEGKNATYESYTTKNRFDRFVRLHLPERLREEWEAPIARNPSDALTTVQYPDAFNDDLIYGAGKPQRFMPAQLMRNLEFARLGKLDETAKQVMRLSDDPPQPEQLAVKWDSLVPTIESAQDTTQLAGDIGGEVARQLLENGVSPQQVDAILAKSYGSLDMRVEHGAIPEISAVRSALFSKLLGSPETVVLATPDAFVSHDDDADAGLISEHAAGMLGAVAAAVPLTALSIPPAIYHHKDAADAAFRHMDILGLDNFFDHSGNFMDGAALSLITINAAMMLGEKVNVSDRFRTPWIIGSAATGSAFAAAMNVYFESSVHSKAYPNAHFDTGDVLYGSAAGALVSVAFCAAALYQRAKLRRRGSS